MDVIIIGAGAAGLMTAKKLTDIGLKVCVLEARDRIGGRIHSLRNNDFPCAVEAGAEYIHGNLKVTIDLLKEAAIEYEEIAGEMWRIENGGWNKEDTFTDEQKLLVARLKELKDNISIAEFIDRYFADAKYASLRYWLTSYIEGYYAGDVSTASALAFLEEWMNEDYQQYRPVNGYGRMIKYLANKVLEGGGLIKKSTTVKTIRWSTDKIEVTDENERTYSANKVVITVSLGVWLAQEHERGVITWQPELTYKKKAAEQMGFGSAIKILLFFKDAFWEKLSIRNNLAVNLADTGFIISEEAITTWWTQLPKHTSLLTGWVAGPKAHTLKDTADEEILRLSVASLMNIFQVDERYLREQLLYSQVFNWIADPFTRGAYAFSTTGTNEARKILMKSVDDTLFFCGEALYEGTEMGTVEAALVSGLRVAGEVIATLKN